MSAVVSNEGSHPTLLKWILQGIKAKKNAENIEINLFLKRTSDKKKIATIAIVPDATAGNLMAKMLFLKTSDEK